VKERKSSIRKEGKEGHATEKPRWREKGNKPEESEENE
jgi:hypothetical protein